MKLQPQLSACLLAAALLAACVAPPAVAPAQPSSTTAVPSTDATAAPAKTAPAATTGETRTLKHAMGETQVSAAPQRVVTLDLGELDAAITLGIKPVGSVTTFADGKFPEYLAGKTDGIEVVGTIANPNLEKIAALKPDLILSSKTRDEERYALLSQIAPTVFVERLGNAWKDNFVVFADAMGKADEGARVIADYDQRITDLHSKVEKDGKMPVMSVVRHIEGGGSRIYHLDSFVGVILSDAGFERPAGQQLTGTVWTEVSPELIPEVDGDVLVYGLYGKAEESQMSAFESNPLWATLTAVKNKQAFSVPDEYWFVAPGYGAANKVIDDLFTYLAPDAAASTAATPAATTTDSAASDAAITRTVVLSDVKGQVTFTRVPSRVVVLEYSYADALFALGVSPIGYADDGVPAYIVARLQATDAISIGTRNEPNLEAIKELHPDLIIADITRHETTYDKLKEIAPTLLLDSYRGSYDTQITIFQDLSRVFHKEAEAATVVAEVQAELAEAQKLSAGHERNIVVGVLAGTGFTAHSSASFKGSLLADLGMPTPLEPKDGQTQFLLDLEGIVALTPEAIVVTCAPGDRGLWDEWTQKPVWQSLEAVKSNQIYVFNRDLWSKSRGLLALKLVLKDARESGLLAGEPSRSITCPDAVLE